LFRGFWSLVKRGRESEASALEYEWLPNDSSRKYLHGPWTREKSSVIVNSTIGEILAARDTCENFDDQAKDMPTFDCKEDVNRLVTE